MEEKSEAQVQFVNRVAEIRVTLQGVLEAVFALKKDASFVEDPVAMGEVIANIMLAYRHTEDARMRLGKVFQALNGGKSVYER